MAPALSLCPAPGRVPRARWRPEPPTVRRFSPRLGCRQSGPVCRSTSDPSPRRARATPSSRSPSTARAWSGARRAPTTITSRPTPHHRRRRIVLKARGRAAHRTHRRRIGRGRSRRSPSRHQECRGEGRALTSCRLSSLSRLRAHGVMTPAGPPRWRVLELWRCPGSAKSASDVWIRRWGGHRGVQTASHPGPFCRLQRLRQRTQSLHGRVGHLLGALVAGCGSLRICAHITLCSPPHRPAQTVSLHQTGAVARARITAGTARAPLSAAHTVTVRHAKAHCALRDSRRGSGRRSMKDADIHAQWGLMLSASRRPGHRSSGAPFPALGPAPGRIAPRTPARAPVPSDDPFRQLQRAARAGGSHGGSPAVDHVLTRCEGRQTTAAAPRSEEEVTVVARTVPGRARPAAANSAARPRQELDALAPPRLEDSSALATASLHFLMASGQGRRKALLPPLMLLLIAGQRGGGHIPLTQRDMAVILGVPRQRVNPTRP